MVEMREIFNDAHAQRPNAKGPSVGGWPFRFGFDGRKRSGNQTVQPGGEEPAARGTAEVHDAEHLLKRPAEGKTV